MTAQVPTYVFACTGVQCDKKTGRVVSTTLARIYITHDGSDFDGSHARPYPPVWGWSRPLWWQVWYLLTGRLPTYQEES